MADLRSRLTALLRRPAAILPVDSPVRRGLSRLWDQFLRATGRHITVTIAGQPLRLQVGLRHIDPDYEAEATTTLLKLVGPGESVWDVGANIGIYTLLTGRAVGPTGRVAAWEPSPASYAILSDHVAANGLSWCQAIQAAVGDRDGGTVPFAVTSETGTDPTNRIGCSSAANTVEVPVGTLDGWAARLGWAPRVVKIDIEGAEVLALRGASNLMSPRHPGRLWFLIAVHPQFLSEYGCRPEDIEDLLGGRDYVALDCAGQVVRPIDYREYLFVPREQLDTARARLASDPR